MNKFTALAVAALVAGAASVASASTVELGRQNSASDYGNASERYVELAKISFNGHNTGVTPGVLRVKETASGNKFAAFCVDLMTSLKLPAPYEKLTTSLFNSSIADNISRLVNAYFPTVNTAAEGAALQLAIWEVIYDDGSADLNGGAFKVTQASADALSYAQGYLANLASLPTTGRYKVTYFQGDGSQSTGGIGDSQDVIGVSPVPLPAGVLLLGGALAGLGVAGAKRRKTA